ncbi:MAG: riboflavin synthase [Deltaproteobacteria bacterium]|nr:riboflavin synthase [Deltaproteobacteria bacterium]
MFTGIIEGLGIVRSMTRRGEDFLLEVDAPFDMTDIKEGDSIAVNGACLTVTDIIGSLFTADVSAETLAKTNLGELKAGCSVNLEKALRLNSFLGGHLVLGHIDCVGKIFERSVRSSSVIFAIEIGKELDRYIVEKGSITVDGISLTVNSYENYRFYVNMVPHTAQMTTLGFKKRGDSVNIEVDILAKYIEKILNQKKGIDMKFLSDHGFVE